MRKILFVLLLTAAIAGGVRGQGGLQKPAVKIPPVIPIPTVTPTVDQVLDKYIQAIGGKEVLGKLSSRVRKGTFEIVGTPLKGETEGYEKAPNKLMRKTTLPGGMGFTQQGYDGKNGWMRDPKTGLTDTRGAELAELSFDSEFNKELRIKELYPRLELKGIQKVNGRDAYLIIGAPAGLEPEKLYFDTQSGLLVRTDMVRETLGAKISFETNFDDYREVGGLKTPFVERQNAPEFIVIVRYESVKYNVPIDDSMFSKPILK